MNEALTTRQLLSTIETLTIAYNNQLPTDDPKRLSYNSIVSAKSERDDYARASMSKGVSMEDKPAISKEAYEVVFDLKGVTDIQPITPEPTPAEEIISDQSGTTEGATLEESNPVYETPAEDPNYAPEENAEETATEELPSVSDEGNIVEPVGEETPTDSSEGIISDVVTPEAPTEEIELASTEQPTEDETTPSK